MATDINTDFSSDPSFDVLNGVNLGYIPSEQNIGGLFTRNFNYDRYAKSIAILTQDDNFDAEFTWKYQSPYTSYGIMRCGWVKGNEPSTIKNTVFWRIQRHPSAGVSQIYNQVFICDDVGNINAITLPDTTINIGTLYKTKLSYVAATRTLSCEVWSTGGSPALLTSGSVVLTAGRTFQLDAFGTHNRYTGQNYTITGRVDDMLVTQGRALKFGKHWSKMRAT